LSPPNGPVPFKESRHRSTEVTFGAPQVLDEVFEAVRQHPSQERLEETTVLPTGAESVVTANRLEYREHGVLQGVFGIVRRKPSVACEPRNQTPAPLTVTQKQYASCLVKSRPGDQRHQLFVPQAGQLDV